MKNFILVVRDKQRNLNKGHTEGGDNYLFHSDFDTEEEALIAARQLNKGDKYQAKYILKENFRLS